MFGGDEFDKEFEQYSRLLYKSLYSLSQRNQQLEKNVYNTSRAERLAMAEKMHEVISTFHLFSENTLEVLRELDRRDPQEGEGQ